jgi:hypothetical protein
MVLDHGNGEPFPVEELHAGEEIEQNWQTIAWG